MTGDPTAWLYDDEDPDPLYQALAAGLDPLSPVRPAWHAQAACRGMGTELFFPERGARTAPAKAVCARCPVTGPCEASATREGIWAGLSANERRRGRVAAA